MNLSDRLGRPDGKTGFGSKTFKDLTGKRFGKLTAERYLKSHMVNGPLWLFRCDCGAEVEGHSKLVVKQAALAERGQRKSPVACAGCLRGR